MQSVHAAHMCHAEITDKYSRGAGAWRLHAEKTHFSKCVGVERSRLYCSRQAAYGERARLSKPTTRWKACGFNGNSFAPEHYKSQTGACASVHILVALEKLL